ncbi:hypothetical protein, partial [Agathobacter sp.]|uniref:hypothetical protein n=1 Tax=Agathobacter sp. TaxID=2021311 RepID=UPI00280AE1E2
FKGALMGNVADYKEPEFLKSDHCTMVFFRLQYMEKLTKLEINIKGGDLNPSNGLITIMVKK